MNKVDIEFRELIGVLSNKQFWEWVSDWYDEQIILDTTSDWDNNIKKEEIEKMKKILEK